MALLQVKDVQKNYGEQVVIKNINLDVAKGELVCLLGVSGVGKTTLFHVISGLYKADQGDVLLDGTSIAGNPGHISYMLQKDLLLPYKTINKNLMLPLTLKGVKKDLALSMVQKELPRFGLDGYGKKYPHQLSGGMRQRAALLRTYFASEGLILLDEPFSALDTITRGQMHSWFLNMMEDLSLSSIFITHDIDEAILLADRIYILAGKPGTLTAEFKIDIPRTNRADFSFTAEFLEYKRQIRAALIPT